MITSLLFCILILSKSEGFRFNRFLSPQRTSVIQSSVETEIISDRDVYTDLKEKLKGTCVYFIGMMGSGKSTTGKRFAEGLGYRFLDTDDIAEFMIEEPISAFFARGQDKVEEFRQLEHRIMMEMVQYTRLVLSTGGGLVMRNDNWGLLRHGIVVFLDMPAEEIFERLMKSGKPEDIAKRPLLSGPDPKEKLTQLLSERHETYSQADVTVRVHLSESPEQVAFSAAASILSFIEKNPPMWQTWKKNRESFAVEAAARMNPSATASADVGFGAQQKGSIQYVSMSDIKSGKVKLPTANAAPTTPSENGDDESKGNSKGFGTKR